ncbi:penicillin-binding protein activator [Terrihabitans soli]|uniref:Penicillin-binding protein activator n=1 Tax=Terrihabitans soli TaxID=708113 RepID=A0A6S6QYJ5_9HYPH|nr:penicillin-binding protein activator [Terrihabitans soli]BCJ92150.1 penicillin-binding protein activator [Terrihabitans soli]
MSVALSLKRLSPIAAILATAFALSACIGGGGGSGRPETLSAPSGSVTSEPLGQLAPGAAKAALILPLTGNAATAGLSMKNAGEMALAEFNNPQLQLIVKDDGGTPQGAAAATQQAIAEGAEIILGPLFAQGAASAGQVARQANIPMLSFSTDASVAKPGVYLLSFLPSTDVDRIISHSVKNGRRSFAAILPEDAYGSVVEGAFQEAVSKNNGRVVALERYAPGDQAQMQASVQRVAQAARGADAIFVPDDAPVIAQALSAAGVDLRRAILIGTGVWDDPQVLNAPTVAGGLYAGPDSAGWMAFAQRYRQRYGSDPVRTATLAYDAVLLAAALTQTQGTSRFQSGTLTSPAGFQGIDGIFRLKSNGLNERGLAVLKVQPGGSQIVAPAPKSFAAAGL